ncbi:MAG: hypothetical protein WC648_04610 [Candidatus Paceibacterota bacterium]|jgi:hypothetical protein
MKKIYGLTLLILLFCLPLYAADVKISELPAVTSTTGATDVVPVVASGVTSKITVNNLLADKAPVASPTFTGKVTTAASAAVAGAGFNLPHGVAPNTPANGDCWTTTAGLYCYVNGSTVGPYSIAYSIDANLTTIGGLSVAQGKFIIGDADPKWSLSAYTFPIAVPTVGKVFISDGTNMIGSTALGTAAYAATGDFAPAATLTAGADASKGNCTDGAAFYYGTDTHILYHCSATNTWTQVYGVGADGSYQMTITNNTAIAPTASANQLYPEANIWKVVQDGVEASVCIGPTAGQVTFTGPTQARSYALPDAGSLTLATLTGSETLTNKTLTAPLVTLPRVAGGAADLSLSAAQVSGTIITNAGQGVVDRNHTLPAAAEGYNFVGFVGTAVAATNYYRFTAATAATMCLDGTCGKAYVTIDTPTQGASVVCYTEQVSSTGMSTATALSAATATDDVKNTAATIDIAGQVYAVAATDGTAPGDDVIVAAKWGVVAFDVGVNGTIDAVEETGQAADEHADEATAIAAMAAQNPEASHVRIGYVTASKSDGTFTFGTDALVTAGTTTANFYNTAAYTKPFNWICATGAGTWVTD